MKIELLGADSVRSIALEKALRDAAGKTAVITRVTEPSEITAKGIIRVPALIIDGEIVSQGKVLSAGRIRRLIEEKTADA